MYSLGLMGLNINNVTQAVRDNIFSISLDVLRGKASQRLIIQPQKSNVMYGLAKLGVQYGSLPPLN